jgi:hypothetical protein
MKRYLFPLRIVLVLAVVNAILSISLSKFLPETAINILYNGIRVVLVLSAGWLVVTHRVGGLWGAALAGAIVILVDHLVIKGGYFLLTGELMAAAGVVVSYVLFVWVEMLVALVGGLAGRWRLRRAVN